MGVPFLGWADSREITRCRGDLRHLVEKLED